MQGTRLLCCPKGPRLLPYPALQCCTLSFRELKRSTSHWFSAQVVVGCWQCRYHRLVSCLLRLWLGQALWHLWSPFRLLGRATCAIRIVHPPFQLVCHPVVAGLAAPPGITRSRQKAVLRSQTKIHCLGFHLSYIALLYALPR